MSHTVEEDVEISEVQLAEVQSVKIDDPDMALIEKALEKFVALMRHIDETLDANMSMESSLNGITPVLGENTNLLSFLEWQQPKIIHYISSFRSILQTKPDTLNPAQVAQYERIIELIKSFYELSKKIMQSTTSMYSLIKNQINSIAAEVNKQSNEDSMTYATNNKKKKKLYSETLHVQHNNTY